MTEAIKAVTEDMPLGQEHLTPLNIPALSKSLKEVYATGGLPLALIFIAAALGLYAVGKGFIQALPSVIYLVGFLVVGAVTVFLIINWIAYRQWRDEVQARTENRRLEMDLYFRLSAANSKSQDELLVTLLKFAGELISKPDSTPEGRKKEITALAESIGPLLNQFIAMRGQMKLP